MNSNQLWWIGIIVIVALAIFWNSNSSSDNGSSDYSSSTNTSNVQQEGLDKVIQKYQNAPTFTTLLYDMDYQNGRPLHKYQVIIPETDTSFREEVSDWYPVSPQFFNKHQDNLGMELASKTDGQLSKAVAPAGYSQYVGNENYGQWVERDGNSFWEFYGKYALLNNLFHLFARPAYYSYYDTYDRRYRPYNREYYGSGYYGTSTYSKTKAGQQSTWTKRPSSFKESVRSRVSQSASTSRSSNASNRTSRSSSRYSNRSPSRSRSGGRGK